MDYVQIYVDVRFWLLKALKLLSDKMYGKEVGHAAKRTREEEEYEGGEGGKGSQKVKTKSYMKNLIAAIFKLLMLVTLPSEEGMIETGSNALFVPLDGRMSKKGPNEAEDGEDEYDYDDGGKTPSNDSVCRHMCESYT